MANKTISELNEYTGLIQGDEILIISKKNEMNEYVSEQYKLMALRNEVGDLVYTQTSVQVSAFFDNLSGYVADLSVNASAAISLVLSAEQVITGFLGDISTKLSANLSVFENDVSNNISSYKIEVSNDLCSFVEGAIPQLKKIVGLSTLNYYTFIGDDINKLSSDPKYPELSALSDDVIWFDTKDDPNFHRIANIRRMDNLQVQIYRLGLQLKDVHKILENGVIPGDAYNNTKDEMIKFADKVQPPEDSITEGKELIEMSIYGNYYCKNGQLYYLLFNPSGFLPDETKFEWIIEDHDDDSANVKTIDAVSGDNIYSLRAALSPKILSSACYINLSAAVYTEGDEPTYVSDQVSVDQVIGVLSSLEQNTMSFYVSSDYHDSTFDEDIISQPQEIRFIRGTAERLSSEFEIQGNDYIDHSTLYYCVLDESNKKFPLNVNTNWFFLSNYYIEDEWTGMMGLSSESWIDVIEDTEDLNHGRVEGKFNTLSVGIKGKDFDFTSDTSSFTFISSDGTDLCTVLKLSSDSSIVMFKDGTGEKHLSAVKSDKYIRTFYPDDKSDRRGQVTFSLLHFVGTPICQVSVELSNCITAEVKDISAVLYVESNYDNAISASKDILGIGGVEPNTSLMEPTVKAVCAKFDEKSSFVEKQATMHLGEIVYFSDSDQLAIWNGKKFMILNSSSSSGLTKEEIQNIGLDYLTFSPNASSKVVNKLMTTSDGRTHILQKSKDDSASDHKYDDSGVGKVWVSHLLQIGKVYAGGKSMSFSNVINDNMRPQSLISHNFIELTNATDEDINLDKIYLMYHTKDPEFAPDKTQSGNSEWEFLKLEGVIKAHGTYLIRGAKCNPCKNLMIDVDKCDLEWRRRTAGDVDIITGDYKHFSRSGELIEFSQKGGSFFLIYATKNSDNAGNGNNVKSVVYGTPPTDMISDKDNSKGGYVDLVGIGSKETCNYYENAPFTSPSSSFNNMLVYKWFYMDPAKQGNKVLYENGADGSKKFRSNKKLLDAINLEKQQVIYRGANASQKRDKFYYDDTYKKSFKPGTTYDNSGMFSTKTHFVKETPNVVNITFGRQATHDGSNLASRCFNWISLGYFDEYVEITGPLDSPEYDETTERYYSITEQDTDEFIQNPEDKDYTGPKYNYHQFYDRIRWTASDGSLVTTHKVIAKNKFVAGTYKYRIGRDGDELYRSEVREFVVHKSEDVNKFSFIQTSDQQGFNWIEYQAWKASCTAISQHEQEFDFTINTGDIAQSGNRVSEWIDYFDGRKTLKSKEEMFTIGNNDLCGSPAHILGDGEDNTSKFNLINVLYYYTFELDTENICYSNFEGKDYPLYSLYSFDYGPWHFISLVSEIRSYYAKAFDELVNQPSKYDSFAKAMNADVERWFKADLRAYMNKSGAADCSKCIVFMHEMPFTIVTPEFFDLSNIAKRKLGRSTAKTGSKLNLENANGNYRFSRLFKKAGIRLVIGGHKHTFALSTPLYDAPRQTVDPDQSYPIDAPVSNEDPFISHYVDKLSEDDEERDIWSRKPVIEMPIDGVYSFVHEKIEEEIKKDYAAYYPQFSTYDALLHSSLSQVDEFVGHLNEMLAYARRPDSSTPDFSIDIFKSIDTQSLGIKEFLRIKFVKKITAPTYSMSQATGYKVVSNKELPSATSDESGVCRYTPWLLSYAAAINSTKGSDGNFSSTKNPVQLRPTYIRYDLDSSAISVQFKQVDGVYTIDSYGNQTSYTLHTQDTVLSCDPITFGAFGKQHGKDREGKYFIPTTLDDYMKIYENYISDDTYIIKL